MTDLRTGPQPEEARQGRSRLHGRFIWYELMTNDADVAAHFYSAVVPGWKFGGLVPTAVNYRMILRSDGGNAGGVLQLDESMREHGAHPAWLGYVGVDDVDATVGEVEAKGGNGLMPPWDVPGVGRLAMIADPQGNPMYVMKPEMPAGGPEPEGDVFSADQEQRVSWNELSTPEPGAARRFYGELFGWSSEEFMPMGEFGEYRFLAHGGQTIGALCGVMPGGRGGWRFYVRVPSIAAAAEAVQSNHGIVTMGPHEVPGGDHIIIGLDPQGAEFALVGKA